MKKTISRIVTAVVFVIAGLFVLRCCMSADRSVFSSPAATEALIEAYSDGESVIYTHSQTSEISPDGYFTAYAMFYNPESGELQLTARWNDSTYKYTDTEKGTEFSFRIINVTTGEAYPCEIIESTKRLMYNYRRIKAEGVSLASDEQLKVVMTIGGGIESEQVVKQSGQPFKEYSPKGSLKKQLLGK